MTISFSIVRIQSQFLFDNQVRNKNHRIVYVNPNFVGKQTQFCFKKNQTQIQMVIKL